jgi:hypothetical protein
VRLHGGLQPGTGFSLIYYTSYIFTHLLLLDGQAELLRLASLLPPDGPQIRGRFLIHCI